jgi:hypothetical protein
MEAVGEAAILRRTTPLQGADVATPRCLTRLPLAGTGQCHSFDAVRDVVNEQRGNAPTKSWL